MWRLMGRELLIYILHKDIYQVQKRSNVLSLLSKSDILRFLKKRGEMGENSLLREFSSMVTRSERLIKGEQYRQKV